MRTDIYTKAVLTVIALLLTVITFKPLVRPDTTANAQGQFAGVQFTSSGMGVKLFDPRTGEFWEYATLDKNQSGITPGTLISKFRLKKLGEPILMEPVPKAQ